jgi:hypothetical protein
MEHLPEAVERETPLECRVLASVCERAWRRPARTVSLKAIVCEAYGSLQWPVVAPQQTAVLNAAP